MCAPSHDADLLCLTIAHTALQELNVNCVCVFVCVFCLCMCCVRAHS